MRVGTIGNFLAVSVRAFGIGLLPVVWLFWPVVFWGIMCFNVGFVVSRLVYDPFVWEDARWFVVLDVFTAWFEVLVEGVLLVLFGPRFLFASRKASSIARSTIASLEGLDEEDVVVRASFSWMDGDLVVQVERPGEISKSTAREVSKRVADGVGLSRKRVFVVYNPAD